MMNFIKNMNDSMAFKGQLPQHVVDGIFEEAAAENEKVLYANRLRDPFACLLCQWLARILWGKFWLPFKIRATLYPA